MSVKLVTAYWAAASPGRNAQTRKSATASLITTLAPPAPESKTHNTRRPSAPPGIHFDVGSSAATARVNKRIGDEPLKSQDFRRRKATRITRRCRFRTVLAGSCGRDKSIPANLCDGSKDAANFYLATAK